MDNPYLRGARCQGRREANGLGLWMVPTWPTPGLACSALLLLHTPYCYAFEVSSGGDPGLGKEASEPLQEAAYRSHGCEPVVDAEGERSPRQGGGIYRGRRQPDDAAWSEKMHFPSEPTESAWLRAGALSRYATPCGGSVRDDQRTTGLHPRLLHSALCEGSHTSWRHDAPDMVLAVVQRASSPQRCRPEGIRQVWIDRLARVAASSLTSRRLGGTLNSGGVQ